MQKLEECHGLWVLLPLNYKTSLRLKSITITGLSTRGGRDKKKRRAFLSLQMVVCLTPDSVDSITSSPNQKLLVQDGIASTMRAWGWWHTNKWWTRTQLRVAAGGNHRWCCWDSSIAASSICLDASLDSSGGNSDWRRYCLCQVQAWWSDNCAGWSEVVGSSWWWLSNCQGWTHS